MMHHRARPWAAALACGLAGCAPADPGAPGDPSERALRATASHLAAPPEAQSREPVPLEGALPLVGFRFIELEDPADYLDVRLRAGEATLAARRSRVLDDIERAAARLTAAGLSAGRIANADRARVAALASAWGQGRDMPFAAEILERVRANRWAVEAALSQGRAWSSAFRTAADQVRTVEGDQDLNGRFNGALRRLDGALERLARVRDGLASAMDGLPADPAR